MSILPREMFAQRLEQLSGWTLEEVFPPAGICVRLAPASFARLKTTLGDLLLGERPCLTATLQETLTDAIIEACHNRSGDTPSGSPAAWFHFRRAVSRLTQDESPLRMTELAQDLGVTLRSLETAFRCCVDMPPAKYLRRERLNRVHRDLIERGPSETTVTDLAMRHGFTELGRFAGEYRRVFGERPSQTLYRRTHGTTILRPGLR